MSIFDSYLGDKGNQQAIEIKPFHTVKDKDEKNILNWLNSAAESLLKYSKTRHQSLKSNLAAYRGYSHGYEKSTPRREYLPTSKREKLTVNHLFDLVETKVAQLGRLKPSVQLLPKNDEFGDKNSAKASKLLLDHYFDIKDFDRTNTRNLRHKKLFGESYTFITWDKYAGDKHPAAGTVLEDGTEVPKDLTVGEVCLEMEVPWRVLLEPADKFEKSKFAFRIHIEHIEDLKLEYPEKKKEIKANDAATLFDYSTLESVKMKDHVVVYEFWHKKTKNCPQGFYAKFTKDVLLEHEQNMYTHGEFPFVRDTDLDIPGVMHGVSQLDNIKEIQNMHNKISSLIAKNIYLTAHPKWMVPKGAVKIESLGNDATVVQYQGPVMPQLATYQSNSSEVYSFRESLATDMERIYSVHGVSRGQPPSGITAAVALQFLNEQEAERASDDVAKLSLYIKNVAKKVLAVMGDYYETDDNRMVRILGKENRFLLRHFDAANLSKPYDVKIDLGNALADSKPAQMQRIIELVQYKPDALSGEQIIEMLDLGKADKMINQVTLAVRTAESEVEDMMEGKEIADPEPWEDLIVHWRVKVKAIQSRSFKEEVPPEIREVLKENIKMIEFLMTEKAKENPKFQAEVAQLSLFPIFYKEGFTAQSAEQQALTVQGQSNRGEEITGQIPAANPSPLPNEPQS